MAHSWHQVFSTALASQPRIGVYATIRDYLGREPTRAELNAGRRAAHSFAAGGHAILVNVLASPRPGSPPLSMAVLGRPGTDMTNPNSVAAAASGEKPPNLSRRPLANPAGVVPGLVKALERAADTGRLMDLHRVTPEQAARLAAELTDPLEKISQIRNKLRQRGRES